MKPVDLQIIGQELVIKWDDGVESYIGWEKLRRYCPCAGCQGERDILGNLYKAKAQTLAAEAFQLRELKPVGGYAVQPVWGDGHATGLYAFDYLRRLTESA